MKKFLILIFLVQALLSACALDTTEMYNKEIYELTQDPKTRKWKGNENDVSDLRGCQVLFKMGRWERYGLKFYKDVWNKDGSWFDGRIVSSGGVSLDFPTDLSFKILQDKNYYPVYIGPWRYSSTPQKNIRFFAYQPIEGGEIKYQYESINQKNKNIKEKAFSLSPNAKIAPDKFSLCVVKWTAKYGYNAVAEVKSKNPFSKNYLIPTGKIIEAKE